MESLRDWLVLVIGVAAALSPFVASLVAAIKTAFGKTLPDAYYPLVSVCMGEGLAVFVWWAVGLDIRQMLFAGGLAGLMASGLYAGGKALDRAMQ